LKEYSGKKKLWMKADLHLHTTASDGRLKPRELVHLAVEIGLDVIAITDHDAVDGITEALAAALEFPDLTVVPGVELSTDVPKGEVHILGYFIDYTDKKFLATLENLRDSRKGRALRMVAKLRDLGIEIKWEEVQKLAQDSSIGRPHIAQAMLEAGYVSSLREAFDNYIGRNGPAYAEREKMTPLDSVKLIVNVRGLPVLAHPADVEDVDTLLPELIAAGLVGMEVCYGKYKAETISRLFSLAKRHHIIPTGGTDYHHFEDGTEAVLGSVFAPSQTVEQLFSLADKRSLALIKRHL
jgi:predicted metal-dependent phosphoesterase TrpH